MPITQLGGSFWYIFWFLNKYEIRDTMATCITTAEYFEKLCSLQVENAGLVWIEGKKTETKDVFFNLSTLVWIWCLWFWKGEDLHLQRALRQSCLAFHCRSPIFSALDASHIHSCLLAPHSQPLAHFLAFLKIMEWVELGSDLGLKSHFKPSISYNLSFKWQTDKSVN